MRDSYTIYTIYTGIPHTTGYITPTWGVFQARLLDNQEGANTERSRLRKALGEMVPTDMASTSILVYTCICSYTAVRANYK